MGALLSAGPTDVLRVNATTRGAFVDGLTTGLALNAGMALVAAVIALRTLPRSGRAQVQRPTFARRRGSASPTAP